MILEGPNGQSFFFKETLLAEGLAKRVDLVNRACQAIDLIRDTVVYDLIVINLVEAWEQGMQLGLWLSQQTWSCPTILIISSDLDRPIPSNGASMVLSEPLSLREFANSVRVVLRHTTGDGQSNIHEILTSDTPNLPSWSGGPLEQEYVGYWSPYTSSFLS
jgi:DNA-binding response OmpR family regulator